MRKKINNRFLLIAFISVLVTTILMTSLFYTILQRQVMSDLEVVTDLLIDEGSYENKTHNIRVTVVDPDGTVAFDSTQDAQSLENHLDRPEIAAALEGGSGQAVRKSNTLSENVFYYAERLDNGQVLRVGKTARSVWSVLLTVLPWVIIIAIFLVALCLIMSHLLTRVIIKPIERMAGDMDHIRDDDGYPELVPFINKIRTQHEELLSATNMRQEFTANVSHELKTPLAAISGYAELMESGMVNEKDIRHFSGEIRKSAARLLNLINDIIKLSQLDEGDNSEVLEVVDLAKIAEESVEMLSVSASKNQVKLTYEGAQEANVRIGRELGQELVYNLIENAIRYNRWGGKVRVRVVKDEYHISLIVKDSGIGIPKVHQERIFERFYRVDKSRSKELGGTGLGLAIVKHICTMTDGDIKLESRLNVGTTITVTWAAEAMQQQKQPFSK